MRALRKHPNATGYVTDLYSIRGADAETENHLEGRFFSSADNDAAQALAVLEAGGTLSAALSSGWSRFIMTLLQRHPEGVSKWASAAARASAWADQIRARNATFFPAGIQSSGPVADPKPSAHYAARATVEALRGLMDSEPIRTQLNHMAWVIIPLQSSQPLLTSDRPLWMAGPIAEPSSFMFMPIGPRRLFIAANDPARAHMLAQKDHDDLAMAMNERVAAQAVRFVWGIDNTQLSLVERLLGMKLPMSPADVTK